MNSTITSLPVATPEKMLSGIRWLDTLTIGLLIGTTLTIIKRFYIRARITRTIGGTDWFMLATQILFTITCALSLTTTTLLKTYIPVSAPTTTTQTTTLLKALTVCYSLSSTTSKISLSSYLPKQAHRLTSPILNILLVLHSITTTVFIAMTLFPCGADLALSLTATCNATRLSTIANLTWSTLNAALGALLFLASIADIIVAKDLLRAKLLASLISFIGAASVGASAARLILLLNPVDADLMLQKLSLDTAGTLEIGLAVTAGTMILFRPLLSRWLGDGSVVDLVVHGEVTMVESRPVTRGRPETRGRSGGERKERKGRTEITTKRVEELEWAERVDRKKRNGVYVVAQELEDGLSPVGSPNVEQSIWKS
ncbi:hypothetical protein B9Z65_2286 [Elsinoe australis]|uniref:Uncharacterized protein n=1 Tax=Elsinoe australis TaxID=40998 RepID=A0A2P7ZA93_9PEZI|nr:hypothetical protein B9Z65_2286 [Elsinoe australis]